MARLIEAIAAAGVGLRPIMVGAPAAAAAVEEEVGLVSGPAPERFGAVAPHWADRGKV